MGNFENDDALDWAADLEFAEDLKPLKEAFKVIDESGYLEAPDCSNALAAAEIVSAIIHPKAVNENENFPEEAIDFVKSNSGDVPDNLVSESISSTQKVIESSELKELWSETDDLDKWLKIQEQLLHRLQQ